MELELSHLSRLDRDRGVLIRIGYILVVGRGRGRRGEWGRAQWRVTTQERICFFRTTTIA